MRSIRINRKKWANADTGIGGLWNKETQKGCCLGHVIHQTQRCNWNELDNLPCPNDFFEKEDAVGLVENNYPYPSNSPFSNTAIEINDNELLSSAAREKSLIELFRKNGLKLEFYN